MALWQGCRQTLFGRESLGGILSPPRQISPAASGHYSAEKLFMQGRQPMGLETVPALPTHVSQHAAANGENLFDKNPMHHLRRDLAPQTNSALIIRELSAKPL